MVIALSVCNKCGTLYKDDGESFNGAYAFNVDGKIHQIDLCIDCAEEAKTLLKGAGFPLTLRE